MQRRVALPCHSWYLGFMRPPCCIFTKHHHWLVYACPAVHAESYLLHFWSNVLPVLWCRIQLCMSMCMSKVTIQHLKMPSCDGRPTWVTNLAMQDLGDSLAMGALRSEFYTFGDWLMSSCVQNGLPADDMYQLLAASCLMLAAKAGNSNGDLPGPPDIEASIGMPVHCPCPALPASNKWSSGHFMHPPQSWHLQRAC